MAIWNVEIFGSLEVTSHCKGFEIPLSWLESTKNAGFIDGKYVNKEKTEARLSECRDVSCHSVGSAVRKQTVLEKSRA